MRIVGLITEYNPFHNGHLHHLQESLRGTGAQGAVAIMSGHFLQRGEPALTDKWVRAEMALRAGVDLVLELPFPFACNSAPHFASGAVQSLNALGGITDLSFGSESGDLPRLPRAVDLLASHGEEIERETAALLRKGRTWPQARAEVASGLDRGGETAHVLEAPNNILGIEYLQALRRTGSPLVPFTVLRRGAGYHDEAACGNIASATGIRKMLEQGQSVSTFLPPSVAPLLEEALAEGLCPDLSHLWRIVASRLLLDPEALAALYLVDHGMGERLQRAALESDSWDTLVEAAKGRQQTRTRVQRTLMHLLNATSAAEMEAFLAAGPLYLRVLGATRRGEEILAAGRKVRTLPLLTNMSRAWNVLRRFYRDGRRARIAERMLQADLRATRQYSLLVDWKGNRNRDFFIDPVRLKSG